MNTKCSLCGAPLVNGNCGYCGYKNNTQKCHQENKNDFQESDIPISPTIININQEILPVMHGVSRKDKTIALLLCIFLGGFGAHRFYVGKAGSGILYLFTGGLFGIGWIIDVITIAFGRFKDEFDLPLQ